MAEAARAAERVAARAPAAPQVVVVGAGIGGLVTALLLTARGLRVTLLEAAATPGGKMRHVEVGGRPIDAGPTVLTMRWVFEHIFGLVGAELRDHVALEPLQVLARHAWGEDPEHDRLDLLADHRASSDAIARFAGPAEARRFEAFCAEARKVYRTLEGPYIRSPRPSVAGMVAALGPRGLAQLTALGPLTSLASLLARRFEHPRLRQLFGRYATYCGASPWAAPATLLLVTQVEMDGVWSVGGGLHGLALAVEKLARRCGAAIHYGAPVSEIVLERGRARGVRCADGRHVEADAVVFAGDTDALADGLLGDAVRAAVPRRRKSDRSLSALTTMTLARTSGFPLARHNVFFHDGDYAAEFDDIFRAARLPARGTVYVCAQDRHDGLPAPEGPERLLLLVNAPPADPARDGAADEEQHLQEIRTCEQTSLALLRRCGLALETASASAPALRCTPRDFRRLFPGSCGSLYGTATNGWMALFRRPGSSTRIPGLMLAGGSVHPGPGVPMAALSGVRAAETVLAHLASTRRSHAAATSGGTSMPSATTAGTG